MFKLSFLTSRSLFSLLLLATLFPLQATPTENNSLRVLPAPAQMKIDGKTDEWDLGSGIFACDDVEHQRDRYGVWVYAMYDANNLYILARFVDRTPLDNPGQSIADSGWQGDCLQFRIVINPDKPDAAISHWTCWKGRDGGDNVEAQYGKTFDEKPMNRHTKDLGSQQAFSINPDKMGYVQEIAIPWKLITDGKPPTAGDTMKLTFEPNFTVGSKSRLTIKDLFVPNIRPDRVFTFMQSPSWGPATFLDKAGPVVPQSERLADGREFPVKMENGIPVVQWEGLDKIVELPGFKTIKFTMPEEGYISLNIKAADGSVARQLLNAAHYDKGPHEVKWDGLTNLNAKEPGHPVEPGEYSWSALTRKEIGLKLRGWADNSGSTPWDDGGTTNWGGDEGSPEVVAADETQVYLGWSFAEAGNALLACDLDGKVKWRNKHGGMAGVQSIAVDNGTIYIIGGGHPAVLYKLDTKDGSYTEWSDIKNVDLDLKAFGAGFPGTPLLPDSLAANDGKVYLGYGAANKIVVLDGKSGKSLQTLDVASPGAMQFMADGTLYVISGGTSVLKVDASGASSPVISGLVNARALALDKSGNFYVGVGDPDNQIKIFDAKGAAQKTIGQPGGRNLLGKWTPNGLRFISSVTVSGDNKIWVAEFDNYPRRFSRWNAQTGALEKEFFGCPDYGALGGAIDPLDPNVMVGQGCEWKMDPATGLSTCAGVITRDGMSNSRFAVANGGRLYLVVAPEWAFSISPVITFYERTGEGEYKTRSKMYFGGSPGVETTRYWADKNGDGEEQPDEITTVPGKLNFSGWYMSLTPDLTFYGRNTQFKPVGFTAAGAPQYDLAHPVALPHADEDPMGVGSADGRRVIYNGGYGADRSEFHVYDIAAGKQIWSYPDNYVGVHGSHNATPAETGMIRGAYSVTGTAALPAPIGDIWVIPTNVGEWHILTTDGFYLTNLFEPDQLLVQFPSQAIPGADMSLAPSGSGGEDFGGSIACGKDGTLYIQSGKTAYWNLEVTGLDTVKALAGEKITISPDDVKKAEAMRESEMQAVTGKHVLALKKVTSTLTGNLANDFQGSDVLAFQKAAESAVKATATWDDTNLYLAWDVGDPTPWVNTAKVPEDMYVSGDTVDFQMGTDPDAPKDRSEAVEGDFRLSIGNLNGTATAVIYRLVSKEKKPHVFSSGVIHAYPMDFVGVLPDVKITVNPRSDGYVVEAVVPLASIGLKPSAGLKLRGDFGVTHGGAGGTRTRLRTYWNNQHTGLVDDAVFEVQMEPKNWGELDFVP